MTNENSFLNLQGKVAIITGAATGLGATTARMLAAAGANVLINHMPGQESQAQAVANDCATENICLAGDITRDKGCKRTAKGSSCQFVGRTLGSSDHGVVGVVLGLTRIFS